MQFQLTVPVVHASRWSMQTAEGHRSGGRIIALAEVTDPERTKISDVQEFTCDEAVFDQIPEGFKAGDDLELICTMNSAKNRAGSRVSNIHVVGVVPKKSGTTSTAKPESK